jgi:internalin A
MKGHSVSLPILKVSGILIFLIIPSISFSCVSHFPSKSVTINDILAEKFEKPYDQISNSELRELTKLSVDSKNISSLEGIQRLTGLETIIVHDTNISDLNPLSNLPNLKELLMSNNKITDVTPLSKVITLEYIKVIGNQIKDIKPLIKLTNLKHLAISNNPIQDISDLSQLLNLNILNCAGTQISDISPLSNLNNLYWMDLSRNHIEDVSPLSKMTSLNYVILDGNSISDVSSLSNCKFVERIDNSGVDSSLFLRNNKITNITGLAGIQIKVIDLENNNISDLKSLVENPGSITFLSVNKNPLSSEAIEKQIPLLVKRGVEVMWNDQNFE